MSYYPLSNDLEKIIKGIEKNGTPYTEIELSSSNEYQTILQIIQPNHYILTKTHEKVNQNTFIIKGEANLITFKFNPYPDVINNREVETKVELSANSFINIPKGTKHRIENYSEDQILFLLTFYSPKLHFMKNPEDSYFSVKPFPEIRADEIN